MMQVQILPQTPLAKYLRLLCNSQFITRKRSQDGEKNCYIQQGDTGLYYLVNPVTVCEFTGFYDTSVRRIFESDILRVWHSEKPEDFTDFLVYFCEPTGSRVAVSLNSKLEVYDLFKLTLAVRYEVVDNAYDNMEKISEVMLNA